MDGDDFPIPRVHLEPDARRTVDRDDLLRLVDVALDMFSKLLHLAGIDGAEFTAFSRYRRQCPGATRVVLERRDIPLKLLLIAASAGCKSEGEAAETVSDRVEFLL